MTHFEARRRRENSKAINGDAIRLRGRISILIASLVLLVFPAPDARAECPISVSVRMVGTTMYHTYVAPALPDADRCNSSVTVQSTGRIGVRASPIGVKLSYRRSIPTFCTESDRYIGSSL